MSTPSNVAYQVMWNRMISIVEEQAQALVRTAFSTSVREAGDLSAGVYDTAGQMLAQAVTGTPVTSMRWPMLLVTLSAVLGATTFLKVTSISPTTRGRHRPLT